MSDDEHFEELSEQAEANTISLYMKINSRRFGIGIMAARSWTFEASSCGGDDSQAQIIHVLPVESKIARYFALPKPKTMRTLEADMDIWFLKNKRGTGCRILPVSVEDEDKTYFLVRHGMPFKREGEIKSG